MSAVAIFTLLACSTLLIPMTLFMFVGDRIQAHLDTLKAWLPANNSTLLIILFLVLGANNLGSGLAIFD